MMLFTSIRKQKLKDEKSKLEFLNEQNFNGGMKEANQAI